MSDIKQFKLPDVGEGLTEAEIVTWKVKVGDTVKINDVIVEIETAKSIVELPSPYAGVVTELLAAEGDTVDVGAPIIAVETGDPAAPAADAPAAPEVGSRPPRTWCPPQARRGRRAGPDRGPAPGGRTSVLVGYGPRTTEAKRRPRKGATPAETSPAAAQVGVQHSFAPHTRRHPRSTSPRRAPAAPAEPSSLDPSRGQRHVKVLAKPPVRKLAKDLGVDLATVTATGPDGTITRDDVAEPRVGHAAAPEAAAAATLRPQRHRRARDADPGQGRAQGDRPGDGGVGVHGAARDRVGHRRRDPHDEDGQAAARATATSSGVKVSPLLIVARAVCLPPSGVRRSSTPAGTRRPRRSCSSTTSTSGSPRPRRAACWCRTSRTPQELSAVELATALGELTTIARDGKTPPADRQAARFTITNVGVFGVDAGTPILNPGESAILCMGAIKRQPWVVGNKIKPRWVTTLALSFDHRVVDGEQGSRFLADVAVSRRGPRATPCSSSPRTG